MTLEYHNPKIPEGINASQEHPLKEFFWLAGGVLVTVLVVVLALSVGGAYLARQIPFAKEQQWAGPLEQEFPGVDPAMDAYLQQLADRLTAAHPLPEGMSVQVHYDAGETVNAFASLGGHIVIFQGLIDQLESENALAMVVAHEIAHVRERHPIESLGRTAGVSLFMALISSAAGGGADFLSTASMLTLLRFSREQESAADAVALEMVASLYGHVAGADEFFSDMQVAGHGSGWVPEFALTHPLHEGRLEALWSLARKNNWPTEGVVRPLVVMAAEAEKHDNE